MTKQQNVLNYFLRDNTNLSPLSFHLESDLEEAVKKLPFEKLVLVCLELSAEHNSYNVKDAVETSKNRSRSVIDIWRHVKYFSPETSIFEVMSHISQNTKFGSIFCGNVKRRVFRSRNLMPLWEQFGTTPYDEFGLEITEGDWDDIHLEPQEEAK